MANIEIFFQSMCLSLIFFKNLLIFVFFLFVYCAQPLRRVQLFGTPWTVAHRTPLSMGFLRQEYWSGLPFSPPGDLPDPGIEATSPALAGGFFATEPSGEFLFIICVLTCYLKSF